jgi:hypothetical protein
MYEPSGCNNGEGFAAPVGFWILGCKQKGNQLSCVVRVEVAVENVGQLINADPHFKKPPHGTCSGVEQEEVFRYLNQDGTTAPLERGNTGP